MQKLITYLKLFRSGNLLFIILTEYALHYFLIVPTLQSNGLHSIMTPLDMFLLILSTVLIAAGGYVINDYFDVNIDTINKPEKLYISKSIRRREAILLHQILSEIAILIGIYFAWRCGNLRLMIVQPITIAFLDRKSVV